MSRPRAEHTTALLATGRVLLAGGYDGTAYTSAAELYDSATGTFLATGNMSVARGSHTAVLWRRRWVRVLPVGSTRPVGARA